MTSRNTTLLLFTCLCLCFSCKPQVIKIGTLVERVDSYFARLDESIVLGVQLYADWTNEHGGLKLGDTTYNISVISVNATLEDGETLENRSLSATLNLINDHGVDVLIGPYAVSRILLASAAANNSGIPYFVVAGSSDFVFERGIRNLWNNNAGAHEFPIATLQYYIDRETASDQTFVLFSKRADPFYESIRVAALEFLNTSTQADVLGDFNFTAPSNEIGIAEVTALLPQLKTLNPNVLFVSGVQGVDSEIFSDVFQSNDYAPKGVMGGSPIDNIETGFLRDLPEFWTFSVSIHEDMQLGRTGYLMGTTKDYFNYFREKQGTPLTISYTALASAVCLAWQLGAQRAGNEWKNETEFIHQMHNLQADSYTETFYGHWHFDEYGRNIAKSSGVVQYYDGKLRLLTSPADLVYPAPWPWLSDSDDSSSVNVPLIVGLTVGLFVLLVIVIIIVIVVTVVVILVKYQILIVPKSGPVRHEDSL